MGSHTKFSRPLTPTNSAGVPQAESCGTPRFICACSSQRGSSQRVNEAAPGFVERPETILCAGGFVGSFSPAPDADELSWIAAPRRRRSLRRITSCTVCQSVNPVVRARPPPPPCPYGTFCNRSSSMSSAPDLGRHVEAAALHFGRPLRPITWQPAPRPGPARPAPLRAGQAGGTAGRRGSGPATGGGGRRRRRAPPGCGSCVCVCVCACVRVCAHTIMEARKSRREGVAVRGE